MYTIVDIVDEMHYIWHELWCYYTHVTCAHCKYESQCIIIDRAIYNTLKDGEYH